MAMKIEDMKAIVILMRKIQLRLGKEVADFKKFNLPLHDLIETIGLNKAEMEEYHSMYLSNKRASEIMKGEITIILEDESDA